MDRLTRLKKGEPMEALVAEAKAAAAAGTVNLKTRRDDQIGVASKGKSKKAKAKEAGSAG
jgi:hypothetical protein